MGDEFERDEAAIDAMTGAFRRKRFREIPPDPRRIDTDRLLAMLEHVERLPHEAAHWRGI